MTEDTTLRGEDDGELWTIRQAREYLHASTNKMAKLVKTGVLKYEKDPLDERIRLVRRAHIEQLGRFHARAEHLQRGKAIVAA